MSGGGIEREREGAREQGREGNFKGGSIFTNQPFTNRPLPLRLGAYAMAWTRAKPGNHLVPNKSGISKNHTSDSLQPLYSKTHRLNDKRCDLCIRKKI